MKTILQVLSSLLEGLHAQRKSLARFLVVGFVVMGVAMAVLMAPFGAPDESTHWRLATTRLDKIFHPHRTCVPFGDLGVPFLYEPHDRPHNWFNALSKRPPDCSPHPKMYGGTLTYPGAVVSLLLFTNQKSDRAEYIRAYFIARLLQGLFVALVMWRVATLMLDKQTAGTLVVLGFPLVALAVQESFTITADGVVIAFALMLCAVMTSLDRFRARDVALFAFCGYCSSISKPFITPVILPALFAGFVFMRKSSQPHGLASIIREFLQLFVPRRRPSRLHVLVWVGCILCVLSAMATFADFGSVYLRVDPAVQKAFLLSHPRVFFFNLPASVVRLIDNLDVFNGPLGVLDVPVSPGTVTHYRHLLYALVLLELMLLIRRFLPTSGTTSGRSGEIGHPLRRRWAPILAAGLLVLGGIVAAFYGVIASLYLTWTARGQLFLQGFQSRYAIPHVLLLLALFAAGFSATFPPRDQYQADSNEAAAPGRIATGVAQVAVAAILLAMALLFFGGLYFDLQKRYS